MDDGRLRRQINFIVEIDKLKNVYRRTILIDRSRNENSAEHSWHIALMAALLAEHAGPGVDAAKVMRMLLVHDLVEIDAGDTYCYDRNGNTDKSDRERRAADRIFNLLPSDQAQEMRALWEEFEARETPDAKFANALDRLQPLLNNFHTNGESWQKHGVTVTQVQKRAAAIAEASPALGEFARGLLSDAVERGFLARANT